MKMGSSVSREDANNTLEDPKLDQKVASVMNVSTGVVQRITTGEVDEEVWLEKIAATDRNHTEAKKLNQEEALKMIHTFEALGSRKIGIPCAENRKSVAECLIMNKGEPLRCSEEVDTFVKCVDKLLYRASRPFNTLPTSPKKSSLAEQFHSLYS